MATTGNRFENITRTKRGPDSDDIISRPIVRRKLVQPPHEDERETQKESVDEKSVDGEPVDEEPVDEKSVDEKPVDEKSIDEEARKELLAGEIKAVKALIKARKAEVDQLEIDNAKLESDIETTNRRLREEDFDAVKLLSEVREEFNEGFTRKHGMSAWNIVQFCVVRVTEFISYYLLMDAISKPYDDHSFADEITQITEEETKKLQDGEFDYALDMLLERKKKKD